MSTITRAKPYRVTFEETFIRYVDVLAVADWQAIEIARQLHEIGSEVVEREDLAESIGNWKALPLQIGGVS